MQILPLVKSRFNLAVNFLFKALGAIKLYLPPGEFRVRPLTEAPGDGETKVVEGSF